MELYLGIDAGSVSTKAVILDGNHAVIASSCRPTGGKPLNAARQALTEIRERITGDVRCVAVTGSARELVGTALNAVLIKNEITCQAIAAVHYIPDARTVIEIGGQDSKLIILRDGLVQDFAMNTVCAAGTGSFLEHQARRLGLSIEEFSVRAQKSSAPVKIAGRCTVFAESDMINAQQSGSNLEDIIYGLCLALVRNFLGDTGRTRPIHSPVIFQGGVGRNMAMAKAFEALM